MIQEGEHLMREVTRDLEDQPKDQTVYQEINHVPPQVGANDARLLPLGPATSYALSHVGSQE